MVAYEYDAWGKVSVSGTLAESIGTVNPLRYRGYYYDNESGFYYLMSRYYDAVTGRFLNADAPLMLGATEPIILSKGKAVFTVNISDDYIRLVKLGKVLNL